MCEGLKKSYVLSEGRCHRGQIQAMVPLGVTEGSAGHTASATMWQWLQRQLNSTTFLGDNIDFWPFLFKTRVRLAISLLTPSG